MVGTPSDFISLGLQTNRPYCLRSQPSKSGSCLLNHVRTGPSLTPMNPRQIISGYVRAPDFERMMVEHDPTFKFRNEFLNRFFPPR